MQAKRLADKRLADVRRILVLNRIHIGDCLLTTPLLRALKRRFPRARVVVATPSSNKDLLATNPHVDEIVERPQTGGWGAKFQFAFDMRARGFDLVISLQEKSMFYGWATLYTKLLNGKRPITIALDHPRTRRFYDYRIPVEPDQHEVYKYLGVANLLGCPRERNPVLELETTEDARARVDRLITTRGFDSDSRFIGINPGGSKPNKRWGVDRFAEVANRLQEELGLPVMVLGGPGDLQRATAIAERIKHRPLVMAGRATLGDTAALLERCRFLVTGDTGPMHMAVALAVPVVALFGPTSPIKFGPFTSLREVLRHDQACEECPRPCLHTITVEECVEAALRLYTSPPVAGHPNWVGSEQRPG